MGKIIALDLGSRCGAAVLSGSTYLMITRDFRPNRGESYGMRFLRFQSWLAELHAAYGFDVAVYEQVVGLSQRGGQSAQHQIYGGMLAMLATFCDGRGIEYTGVPVTTIKRHATGRGNASKSEMAAALAASGLPLLGDTESEDAVDACWLLDYSLSVGF